MHDRSARRILGRPLAVSATLGLATTLAIAAWLGATLDVSPSGYLGEEPEVFGLALRGGEGRFEGNLTIEIDRCRGVTVIRSRVFESGEIAEWPFESERSSVAMRPWERRFAVADNVGDAQKDLRVVGAGWPCRAIACELAVQDAPDFASHTWTATGGTILGESTFPGWTSFPVQYPKVFPMIPIWEGLAADSLLFGVGWWCILFAPALARDMRRRRAGQCLRCGYTLAGLAPAAPCPECGTHS